MSQIDPKVIEDVKEDIRTGRLPIATPLATFDGQNDRSKDIDDLLGSLIRDKPETIGKVREIRRRQIILFQKWDEERKTLIRSCKDELDKTYNEDSVTPESFKDKYQEMQDKIGSMDRRIYENIQELAIMQSGELQSLGLDCFKPLLRDDGLFAENFQYNVRIAKKLLINHI